MISGQQPNRSITQTREQLGTQFNIKGESTMSGIKLDLQYSWCGMHPEVPLMPLTWMVSSAEGGQPIPFTQFVQQPKFSRLSITSSHMLSVDEYTVIPAGKRTRYEVLATKPALARWLPVGKLLDRKTVRMIDEDVILIVGLEADAKTLGDKSQASILPTVVANPSLPFSK